MTSIIQRLKDLIPSRKHPIALTNNAAEALANRNNEALKRAREFSKLYRLKERTFDEFSRIKHVHPFHGFVQCCASQLSWLMFSASDDIVAWQYFWLGQDAYEPETMKLWIELAGSADKILDIGGYTGVMSIAAALANPRAEIHYFEPLERIIERAQINFRINNIQDRIVIHGFAASNERGTKQIHLYRPENFLGTGSSLSEKAGKISHGTKTITAERLDDIFPGYRPDLIKLDIEGHEAMALDGMASMIRISRPFMIIEVWPHNESAISEFFERKIGNYVLEPIDKLQGVRNVLARPL